LVSLLPARCSRRFLSRRSRRRAGWCAPIAAPARPTQTERARSNSSRWAPAFTPRTQTGNYTLKGTFTLVKPSGHTNYYGLVFGGSDLDGAKQAYTYFLVAQDGTWLVKHRNGDAATDVLAKTPNAAVKKPGADGKSTNALEVRVGADKIDYVVNGTVVGSSPKTAAKTDGIYGIRVNHLLEVHIDGLSAGK